MSENSRLRSNLLGVFVVSFIAVHTILVFIPFLAVALLRLLPINPLRKRCSAELAIIAQSWAGDNNRFFDWLNLTEWRIQGERQLRRDRNYLIISNHQTWLDIIVLLYAINWNAPMWRFFLKQSIIFFPIIGFGAWSLDFPFMRRHSKRFLERFPEQRQADFETIRRTLSRFQDIPVSLVNYVEGTRFKSSKHKAQQSPYRHLLRPKAGGVGLVLGAMGQHIDAVVDLTITYPRRPNFWDFCCGRFTLIIADLEQIPVPAEFVGRNYLTNEAYKQSVQAWLNERWLRKDQLIGRRLGEAAEMVAVTATADRVESL